MEKINNLQLEKKNVLDTIYNLLLETVINDDDVLTSGMLDIIIYKAKEMKLTDF